MGCLDFEILWIASIVEEKSLIYGFELRLDVWTQLHLQCCNRLNSRVASPLGSNMPVSSIASHSRQNRLASRIASLSKRSWFVSATLALASHELWGRITPFPEAKHSSALASPALQNLKRQQRCCTVGPINRTPIVLLQRIFFSSSQRIYNMAFLPSLSFSNTPRSSPSSERLYGVLSSPRQGGEVCEATEAFIPVIT